MRYTIACLLAFLQCWGESYVTFAPSTPSKLSSNRNIFDNNVKYDHKTRTYSVTRKSVLAAKDSGDGDDFFDDYDEFISNFNVEDQNDTYYPPNNSRGHDSNNSYNNNSNRGGNNYTKGRGRKDNFSHDYQRSPEDDTSYDAPGFASTINDLITERLEYRKTGQFGDADAIRDELKDAYGVTVWDRERIWTTKKQSAPPRQRRDNDRFNDRKPRRKERDFGPNGHDYELDLATQGLSKEEMDNLLPEVHSLIAQRLQCKLNRDFRTADSIQEDLFSNYNVEVHDGFKSFRFFAEGDSEWTSNNRQGPKKSRRDNQVRQYKMRGIFPDNSDVDAELIQGLVQKRAIAKTERDYDLADQVRDELKNNYDVVVDDRSGEWSISTQQYLFVGSNGNVPTAIIQEIQIALAERMEAKKSGDYQTADDIRDDLNARYGVSIYDNSKEFEIKNFGGANVDGSSEEFEENISEYEEVNELDEEENELDREALEALTIPLLKEKLRALKLPVSGRKTELIDRILGIE